jgi:hypothetical protein
MANLMQASNQWATRPDDERFSTLQDLHAAVENYRRIACESKPRWADLRAIADDGAVKLQGVNGTPSNLTHWSFGQLASRAGAPGGYLRTLPAPLAAECLNTGLHARGSSDQAFLMFHKSESGLMLRAATSLEYSRIWNRDVTEKLLRLVPDGWRVPPARPCRAGQAGARPATFEDTISIPGAGGQSVRVGDMIAPAGLYASDNDCFVFMVNERKPIEIPGEQYPLYRGFFCWNSEVGASSFGMSAFLFRGACGNHIVWDSKAVREMRLRHVGIADRRAEWHLTTTLRDYTNRATSEDADRVVKAQSKILGKTKDEVIDFLFGLRLPALSRKMADEAYETTERNYPLDGSPRTAWGIAQGLTRVSQTQSYADDRVELDRAAGRVMQIAF